MASNWAYVGCSDFATGSGPTGSVQFHGPDTSITGSYNFMFHTASYEGLAPNTLVLTGTLVVTGTISASHYHIKDVTTIDGTGSTKFGDSLDDTHIRTGSLLVSSSYTNPTSFMTQRVGIGTLDPSGTLHIQVGAGAGAAASTAYDDLVIDSDNQAGITLLTPGGGSQFSGYSMGIPGEINAATFALDYNNSYVLVGSGWAGSELRLNSGNSVNALTLDGNQHVTASQNLIVTDAILVDPNAGASELSAGVISASAGITGSAFKADGDVSAGAFYGDGSGLTGVDSSLFTAIDGSNAYITSSVAIGGTTAPDHTLSVSGTISASAEVSASNFHGSGMGLYPLSAQTSNPNRILVSDGSGNGTLGDNSSDAMITATHFFMGMSGTPTFVSAFTGSVVISGTAYIDEPSQMLLDVTGYNSGSILFVTGSNRVGINTNDPNCELEVSGVISASAGLTGSSIFTDGDIYSGASIIVEGNISSSLSSSALVVGGERLQMGRNTATGVDTFSSVAGGENNAINWKSTWCTIGGGHNNELTGTVAQPLSWAFIGGGEANTIQEGSNNATIGGGDGNMITVGSAHSFIGGGGSNIINTVTHATIGGGDRNHIAGQYGFIGGGIDNVASIAKAVVVGGQENTASNFHTFVGAGQGNENGGRWAAIAGGWYNEIEYNKNYGFIGAGECNKISGRDAVVVGGYFNTASADRSVILGSSGSTVTGKDSFAIGSDITIASAEPNYIVLGSSVVDAATIVHSASTIFYGIVSGNAAVAASSFSVDGVTTYTNGEIDQSSGDFTIDAANYIHLDAGAERVFLKWAGANFGALHTNMGDGLHISSSINNSKMFFEGADDTAAVTALTLDMANAGHATLGGGLTVTGSVSISGSFGAGYRRVATDYQIAEHLSDNYIIGVSGALGSPVRITLPSASVGAGHIIIIKDEDFGTRSEANAITASVSSSLNMVDGEEEYHLYGTMGSITLYSDGIDKWFVV